MSLFCLIPKIERSILSSNATAARAVPPITFLKLFEEKPCFVFVQPQFRDPCGKSGQPLRAIKPVFVAVPFLVVVLIELPPGILAVRSSILVLERNGRRHVLAVNDEFPLTTAQAWIAPSPLHFDLFHFFTPLLKAQKNN